MKHRTAALMLLSALLLASCGEAAGTPAGENKETDAQPGETAAVTEEDTYVYDSLPADLDLGGAAVSIHVRGDANSFLEVSAEQTGEVLDDAIYNRNKSVEERLNVVLNPIQGAGWEKYSQDMTKVRSTIMSGDNAYQIIAGWRASVPSLALDGCFRNLPDYKYLDTAKPWWTQSAVEGMNVGGTLCFVTGDISIITDLGGSYVLFMNDRVASEYDISGVTDSVLDGSWTLDRLISVIKSVGKDVNGDSKRDDGDYYGLILDTYNSADAFLTAADIHQIALDKDGTPVYTEQTERLSRLMEKIYPLYYSEGYDSYQQGDVAKGVSMFNGGQGLFTVRELDTARDDFRNMVDSYTILPMPKLDDAQENYAVCAFNGATLWGIPTSNPDPDTSCAVMEALASASYNDVTPVYFETCLQDKYARNEITIRMLEIIRDGMYVDSEYLYAPLFGNTCYVVRDLISSKKSDVASWYAKNSKKVQKEIDKTMEKLAALEG